MRHVEPGYDTDDIKLLEIIERSPTFRPNSNKGWRACFRLYLNGCIEPVDKNTEEFQVTAKGVAEHQAIHKRHLGTDESRYWTGTSFSVEYDRPPILPPFARWAEHRRQYHGRKNPWWGHDCILAHTSAESTERRAMERWIRRRARENFEGIPLEWLDKRSWDVLRARWIDGKRAREVGEAIGVSKSRVYTIEKRAIMVIWRKAIRVDRGLKAIRRVM